MYILLKHIHRNQNKKRQLKIALTDGSEKGLFGESAVLYIYLESKSNRTGKQRVSRSSRNSSGNFTKMSHLPCQPKLSVF